MYFCRERLCVYGNDESFGRLLYKRISCIAITGAFLVILFCLMTGVKQKDRVTILKNEIKALESSPWLKAGPNEFEIGVATGANLKSNEFAGPKTTQSGHIGLSPFLEVVSQQAKRYGLVVESFLPLAEKREGAMVASHVKLTLEGSYTQFVKYIQQLRGHSTLIGFQDLIIETSGDLNAVDRESIRIALTVAHHSKNLDPTSNNLSTPIQVKPPDSST